MKKKTIIAVVLLIFFAVFIQEKVVEQDIRKAIVAYNDNPSFTKETITEADFDGAAITIFTATWCGYCKGAKQLLNEKEIAYFGLLEEYHNKKLGSYLLSSAIRNSFIENPKRVWVHTCSLDHKNALNNYIARGMKIFKTEIVKI